MNAEIKNVKLAMWERTDMPETNLVDGVRTKTGKKLEYSTYVFVDEFGSKVVFLSSNNAYRTHEGMQGNLSVSIAYDDFKGKKQNKVRLVKFTPNA